MPIKIRGIVSEYVCLFIEKYPDAWVSILTVSLHEHAPIENTSGTVV